MKDALILKWGLLALKIKDFEPINKDEMADISKKFKVDDIVNIFNKSENVFDIEIDEQTNVIFRSDGVINLTKPINLSIKIPKREVEKSSFIFSKKNVDYGTEFNVLYNGYFYIIYRKIDSTKKRFEGHINVRKLLNNIIENSENFEPMSIPPTPFREELFINCSYDENIQEIRINKIKDEVGFEISLPISIPMDDFFLKFYLKMNIDFMSYFRTLEKVNTLEKLENEINELFIELTNNCLSLQNLNFHQFHEEYKLKKKIKCNIAEQFINFSNYQIYFKDLSNEKRESLSNIKENEFFTDFFDEFQKEIDYNGINFGSMHALIDYSKDVIVAHEGNINYIIGVILVGIFTIIGVLIGKTQ